MSEGGGSSRTDHRSAGAGSSLSARSDHIQLYSSPCRTMFRSVSGASLLLQRLNVQLDASCSLRNYRAMRCCRVYRRLSACKAAVLFRPCSFGLEHEIPFGSSSVHVVARARMAAFALNAPREYRDSTNELESFLSVRSPAAVMIHTRRSSTTPEKTRDERAANVQSVSQSY